MKRLIINLVITSLILGNSFLYAEHSIENYGYYDNPDEITAKDDLINKGVANIYDFKYPSRNPQGEIMEQGKYYMPMFYYDSYGSRLFDEDYIAVEEVFGIEGEKVIREIQAKKVFKVKEVGVGERAIREIEENVE